MVCVCLRDMGLVLFLDVCTSQKFPVIKHTKFGIISVYILGCGSHGSDAVGVHLGCSSSSWLVSWSSSRVHWICFLCLMLFCCLCLMLFLSFMFDVFFFIFYIWCFFVFYVWCFFLSFIFDAFCLLCLMLFCLLCFILFWLYLKFCKTNKIKSFIGICRS